MKKQKKYTAIEKACILLRDIEEHSEGRTLALSRKYNWHPSTVSRILITLARQGLLHKEKDGSFSSVYVWMEAN